MCCNECERVLPIWRAFLLVSTHFYPNFQLHWVGTLVFVASIILFQKGVRKTFFKQSHCFAFKGPKKSEKEVVEVGKHCNQDVLTHGHTKNAFQTYAQSARNHTRPHPCKDCRNFTKTFSLETTTNLALLAHSFYKATSKTTWQTAILKTAIKVLYIV